MSFNLKDIEKRLETIISESGYGSLNVVIQDSEVIQIDTTIKERQK